jgi:ERCC4-type nuclease
MSNENRGDESSSNGLEHATVVRPRRHQLRVDLSERNAAVLDLARECDDFDVQMVRLPIGDYLIESGVVVERKTYGDFATSLVDGRLFPHAAALAKPSSARRFTRKPKTNPDAGCPSTRAPPPCGWCEIQTLPSGSNVGSCRLAW